MIILKILLTLAGVYALYRQIKMKNVYWGVLAAGIFSGLIMAISPPFSVQNAGLYVYMGFVALTFAYGLASRDTGPGTRMVLLLMSAGIFTYWLWRLNHWHGNELIAAIAVLTALAAGIIAKAKLRKVSGILILLASDAVAILAEHLMRLF
jgi:hypothetical protein